MCQLHWSADEVPHPEVTVIGDLTGRLKEWFDQRPESFVVLRPDRFVAGAALAQPPPSPAPSPKHST
ncbi:hypothetical protein [Streptomyces sp. NPDC046332]|uniref:hypothetical protein n=1 Tax=Streptomyces sp. NPDC046332 TaxID=3155133 RepID=UPI0033F47D81